MIETLDDSFVVLGDRHDVRQVVRAIKLATSPIGGLMPPPPFAAIPTGVVFVPGDSLYGHRLQLDRLVVLGSWIDELLHNPKAEEWARSDLLCRYRDGEKAAIKIGLKLL